MTEVLAITGTDTGVGKTVVACAIAALARRQGVRCAVMKPLESGIASDSEGSDGNRLMQTAGNDDPMAIVSPYRFREPLSPMVAASRSGVNIDIDNLDRCHQQLSTNADVLLVEGAGGLLVPITPDFTYRELFKRWGAAVVIVAGNRLGVVNHTLLTVEAAERAGLELRGVVLSSLQGPLSMESDIACLTNFDTLAALLHSVPLFHFPWLEHTGDDSVLADAAMAAGLDVLLPRLRSSGVV